MQLRMITHGSQLEGVVEEVDTGTQFKFSSENELIEFLRQRFAHAHESGPQGGNQ